MRCEIALCGDGAPGWARRLGGLVCTLLMCGLLLGAVGCVGPFLLPLEYDPSDPPGDGGTVGPGGSVKLLVRPVIDNRSNKAQLGQTSGRGFTSVPIIASSGSPSQFVFDALCEELERIGVPVVQNPEGANRVLDVQLNVFSINESTSYEARILAMVTISDSSGNIYFEHSVSGEDSTHGWSYSPGNCNQVLSESFVKMFSRLLKNPEFMQALTVRPRPRPTTAPPPLVYDSAPAGSRSGG